MSCYRVIADAKASVEIGKVEADPPKEAIEKAFVNHSGTVHLCHHCTAEVGDDLTVDESTASAEKIW